MTTPLIFGCLLAGGLSSRMEGIDKKHLLYKNHSFLDIAFTNLKNIKNITEVFISSNFTTDKNYPIIKDIYPQYGPLSGIHAIFHYLFNQNYSLENSFIIFIPVDMPLLHSSTLNYLLQQAIEKNCSLYFKEYMFPCVVQYNNTNLQKLNNLISSKRFSIKNFLTQLKANTINLPPEINIKEFNNINYFKDYIALQKNCFEK